jgi:hypothetical protein
MRPARYEVMCSIISTIRVSVPRDLPVLRALLQRLEQG